jgi:hypothetical protein
MHIQPRSPIQHERQLGIFFLLGKMEQTLLNVRALGVLHHHLLLSTSSSSFLLPRQLPHTIHIFLYISATLSELSPPEQLLLPHLSSPFLLSLSLSVSRSLCLYIRDAYIQSPSPPDVSRTASSVFHTSLLLLPPPSAPTPEGPYTSGLRTHALVADGHIAEVA